VYWFIPNGMVYERWTPTAVGALDPNNLPVCLQPLADAGVTGDVSVVSGLDNFAATPIYGGDHACGLCGFLTSTAAKKTADLSQVSLSTSADQLAAKAFIGRTPRPSLELGMQAGGLAGGCDTGYACAYAQSMSWADATTPRGKRTDPHDAWLYLLGNGSATLTPAQRDRLRVGDQSVLDLVLQEANDLHGEIGVSDRVKLDQYMTGVRAVEQQLIATTPVACQSQPDPGSDTDYFKRFGLMMDVMEFALKCDLTRVISFMFANAFGPGPMPWAGVSQDFHGLTHQMGQAGVKDLLQKCITWEVAQVAAFVKRLKAIPEGGTTVLHNTAMMVGSDVSDGQHHTHALMPVLLAGNGAGTLNPGRHVMFTPEDPSARQIIAPTADARTKALAIPNTNRLANLSLTLLKNAGVDVAAVGDSNGVLKGL